MQEKTKKSKRIKVISRESQRMRKNMREFGKNSGEHEKIRESGNNLKESGKL